MGLDFLVTAICFSVLGYGLCYIALSSNKETITAKQENSGET